MNLNQLRFVRAVADAGTFTAAAERCYVTQSTLSTGVALLEKELGERLFVRTTRSVSLTPLGRRLLPLIDRMLATHAELLQEAEDYVHPERQVARLGVCPLVDSQRLDSVLAPYRDANPKVRVMLEQLSGVNAKAVLEDSRFDFLIGPAEPQGSRLERAKLYDDQLVYIAAGPEGTVDDDTPVRLGDIANDTFLLVHEGCGLTALTRRLFRTRRLRLHAYEGQAMSYQILEEWAALGLGSAILPRTKVASPGVGRPIVLGNGHPATIRFEAIWLRRPERPPHLDALARHLMNARPAHVL